MKKNMMMLLALTLITTVLMGFVVRSGKKYGGTASASGKVTYVTTYESTQGRKVGDIETINVAVDCMYDDNAEAKKALKTEIENTAIVKKITLTGAINYDVTTCNN
ncbi:hypothetical protein ACR777_10770 [Sphingobacterium spiritivorum]|uniref:hypothetical protein n=1 Tax=Sphingobacterium spiritivorum TaxID=258 RepID=UPI003DA29963